MKSVSDLFCFFGGTKMVQKRGANLHRIKIYKKRLKNISVMQNPEFWEVPDSQDPASGSSGPNSPADVKLSPQSEDCFREPKSAFSARGHSTSHFDQVQTNSPAAVSNFESCSFSSQDSPNKVRKMGNSLINTEIFNTKFNYYKF